ncbi:hypothetical protein So717_20050 [Roseobacter cerasinus]|uniref:Uncharacterized protein n=1 Tax=Roseobacter cerasinus TaxID=2602289 RepID=A0A640VRE7_9RHOB|nr:hypothetical protein [Roseobacter cerasinus]GFE50252.1 hypothetical protein So717_20050 [Roseobacter cerasinus]
MESRPLTFPDYPQPGRTYLSFDDAHGYQVIFIDSGNRAWLWYPGNARALAGEYMLDTVAGQRAICWRYPSSSGNPVTGTRGGSFNCTPRLLSQKSTIAALRGDPFNLASGAVPYPLQRCVAPEAFVFDRVRFGC